MLLENLMPVYDAIERHVTVVRAPQASVFAAIRSADLSGSLLTRTLLVARAGPLVLLALLRSPRDGLAALRQRARRAGGVHLADFERAGFRVLVEEVPQEVVIGLLGRFWTPNGDLRRDLSLVHFAAGPPPGYALAGWNFVVRPREDGTSELATETRVRCAPDARAKFAAYWLLVRPGSGLIRRAMLRAIRREAERRSAQQPS